MYVSPLIKVNSLHTVHLRVARSINDRAKMKETIKASAEIRLQILYYRLADVIKKKKKDNIFQYSSR